jgi:hypothetical protein
MLISLHFTQKNILSTVPVLTCVSILNYLPAQDLLNKKPQLSASSVGIIDSELAFSIGGTCYAS